MPDEAFALTCDQILDGRLSIWQPAKGHRAGTDAILLAAAAGIVPPGAKVADLGCGVGTVGLIVALAQPDAQVTLVDDDPDILALAERNIAANGLQARVRPCRADLLGKAAARRAAGLASDSFDLVLTNPPFLDEGAARSSPDRLRSRAHTLPADGLETWLRSACALARPKGRLVVIHRADALGAVLAALSGRVGGLAILPILPKADEPARRILVSGIKGSRAPLRLLAPLVLHEADGTFSPRSRDLHRGEQVLHLHGA